MNDILLNKNIIKVLAAKYSSKNTHGTGYIISELQHILRERFD